MPHNWASRATNLQLILREAWTCLHRNYGDDSEGRSCGLLVIPASSSQQPAHASRLCSEFFGEASNQPGDSAPYSPDLVPCDFWLFPTLNHLWKGRDFRPLMRFRKIPLGSCWRLGELCEVPRHLLWRGRGVIVLCTMFLVSCIFFNKCLCFSYYMARYLLDGTHTFDFQLFYDCFYNQKKIVLKRN